MQQMPIHLETPTVRRRPDSAGGEHRSERTRLMITLAVVIGLHIIGFGLVGLAAMSGFGHVLGAGVAVTAYLAGVRHFADADHLCAIDNATRKFVGEQQRPTSVGLAFSLGHSTVVLLMSIGVIVATRSAGALLAEGNPVVGTLGIVGGLVSGGFLVLIGACNLAGIRRTRRRQGAGDSSAEPGTVMSRLMAAPLRRVRRPRHMYLIGFAFGGGFDTATLIGLLVLTATTVASGAAAVYAVALPLCFAAGMTLGDSLNGYFMMRMYARAADDERAPRFNHVVTTMSVVSALAVGTLILAATAREALGLSDVFTGHLAAIDLEYAGFGLMGVFAIAWVAFLVHRRRHGDPSIL